MQLVDTLVREPMWKSVNNGEQVSVGDFVRHQSRSNGQPPEEEKFLVVRTDQHYFEIVQAAGHAVELEPPRRKVIRYIDVGYNVRLERWVDR